MFLFKIISLSIAIPTYYLEEIGESQASAKIFNEQNMNVM